jgi:hypothetical protein
MDQALEFRKRNSKKHKLWLNLEKETQKNTNSG